MVDINELRKLLNKQDNPSQSAAAQAIPENEKMTFAEFKNLVLATVDLYEGGYVKDTEEVVANAFTDLDERSNDLDELSAKSIIDIHKGLMSDEKVIAKALNDLNTRIDGSGDKDNKYATYEVEYENNFAIDSENDVQLYDIHWDNSNSEFYAYFDELDNRKPGDIIHIIVVNRKSEDVMLYPDVNDVSSQIYIPADTEFPITIPSNGVAETSAVVTEDVYNGGNAIFFKVTSYTTA